MITLGSDRLERAKAIIWSMNSKELAELERFQKEVHKSARCYLLDLPPELRNRIYYLASIDCLRANIDFSESPALLKVNHQMREEFLSFYYSNAVMTCETVNVTSLENSTHIWARCADECILKALLTQFCGLWFRQSAAFKGCFDNSDMRVHVMEVGDKGEGIDSVQRDVMQHSASDRYGLPLPKLAFIGVLAFMPDANARAWLYYQLTFPGADIGSDEIPSDEDLGWA